MKLQITLAIGVLSLQPVVISAQTSSEIVGDYVLGRDVGRCLIAKCQVFRGHLVTKPPKSGQAVAVQVDEALFGMTTKVEKVQVPYSTEIFPKAPLESPGYAWRRATVTTNRPLTIVLAEERIGSVKTGEPVFVTSDQRESEVIRSLTEEAQYLAKSPSSAPNAASSVADPAMAGFLYVLGGQIALKDPESASSLFQNLIGNPKVPAQTWSEIAGSMVLDFRRLSGSGRSAVIRRFTELAQSSDVHAAVAGFGGLIRLANSHSEVQTLIPPGAQNGLAKAYRGLIEKGSIQRNAPLEEQLGII